MSTKHKPLDLKKLMSNLDSDLQDLVDAVSIEARSEGFTEGYEKGKADGYNQGYDEGKHEGLEEGKEEENKRWKSKEKVHFT